MEICGIKFGGQPGVYPTVLFGGFFFKGKLDLEKAKNNICNMLDISKRTGNPAIPDFYIKKEENLDKILDFIEINLPKNHPFSVDIIEPSIKIKTLQLLSDRSLLNRTIYNSIHIGSTDEEIEALVNYTPKMVIIVAFNPKDKSPDGRIEVLENGANILHKGLLGIIKDLRISKFLIDTAAHAPGDNSGSAIASIPVVKEEFGFPAGCAIHNVVEKSIWLNDFENSKKIVDFSSNLNIPLFGGDFAIFGPVENSNFVFPIIAWQDILISEYTENYFGIEPSDIHPRRLLI